MNGLLVFQQMSLLLVRRVAFITRIGPKIEMNIVSMATQAISEIENLVTVWTGMAPLVKVCSDVMFGAITLLSKSFTALFTFKLLDFQVDHTMMFTSGTGIPKDTVA